MGYPVGVPSVGWLAINNDTFTESPVTLQIGANAQGLTKGTYTTTIRLVTGKEDGSQIKYVDIPVTFNVTGGLLSETNALSFTTTEGTQAPASQSLKLHSDTTPANWQINIQYNDETKDWLVPSSLSGVLNSPDSSINIAPKALPNGHYSANILLLDGAGRTRKTIPVNYDVAAGFSVTGVTTKGFNEQAKVEDLTWSLALQTNYNSETGKNVTWQITSDQPWLTVVNNSGNLSADQAIQLQLSAEQLLQLNNGNLTANLNFSVANTNVKSVNIPIQIALNLQPALTATGLSSSSFYVGNNTVASELKKSLSVKTNVGSAFSTLIHWQAVTGASWLKFTNSSGDTTDNSTLQLEVDENELKKLANGTYEAIVTLKPDNTRYKNMNIIMGLGVYLATVEHVSPYVAYIGRSEPIIIRGKSFGVQSSIKVNVGNTEIDATVVSDTEIHLNYPTLASEQRVNVYIKNALNIARSSAELVYKQAPIYTSQKFQVNDKFYKISLDPERSAILLSGREANEIRRLRLIASGWVADSFPAQNAQTASLTLDGKEILVSIGKPGFSTPNTFVHLNPDTLAINKSVPINEVYPATGTYDLIAPLNDGRTLLLQSNQWSYAMYYPSQESFQPPSAWGIEMLISRDHSRILLGGVNSGTDNYSYDSNTSVFTPRQLNIDLFRTNNISMSGDGSRLVADNSVYDRNFNFLGSLNPIVDHWNSAVTPNGKYIYVASTDQQYKRTIKRYDISAVSGPFQQDASMSPIELADGEIVTRMTVSDDGKALFALVLSSLENPNTTSLYIFPLPN